jgi:hypothetical protein
MHNKFITMPYPETRKLKMKHNVHALWIIGTADFDWYPADPSPCFPQLLAPNHYPGNVPDYAYGPYVPNGTGTVTFDALTVAKGRKKESKPIRTPHSIIVS